MFKLIFLRVIFFGGFLVCILGGGWLAILEGICFFLKKIYIQEALVGWSVGWDGLLIIIFLLFKEWVVCCGRGKGWVNLGVGERGKGVDGSIASIFLYLFIEKGVKHCVLDRGRVVVMRDVI
jgi:hypothetical protein